jgi:hypothetical protein
LTKTGKKLSNILASTLREKAPVFTETYYAYGNTQELFKECSRPGDYTIPQSLEKGGEIPTDENGVHLGEGTGWWYDSKHPRLFVAYSKSRRIYFQIEY